MFEQLKKEFEYYVAHQDDLVELYNGKFIVIKDCQVIGAFNTEYEAVNKTSDKYEIGTFLVQRCEKGNASYTQTFHSRAEFVNL